MKPFNYINIFIFLIFCCDVVVVKANRKLAENYITYYSNIAVSEMRRTGIPASIKLAQGILESDLGRSPLAFQANNHFGIKCGKDWTGEIYYKYDDDLDSIGTLVESCFRVYKNPKESYVDHSEFLKNPAKQARYGFLFDLSSTDYTGWANGLKFSGYASDPTYASKLIRIIDTYRLYKYDEPVLIVKTSLYKANEANTVVPAPKDEAVTAESSDMGKTVVTKEIVVKPSISTFKLSKINGLKMLVASGKESVKEISSKTGINVFELMEYNEGIRSPESYPAANDIIFLERKLKAAYGDLPQYHVVSTDESMYQISQKYGIRLESLLAKNNLRSDAIPLAGERISLCKNLAKKETPKHKYIEKFDAFVDLGGKK
jgi:hypothetical protein